VKDRAWIWGFVVTLAGCGGSNPAAPPVVTNTPPTIESLTVAGTRAEADRDIQVTAVVRDSETPVTNLTYTWSALPQSGSFTSNGATATWRPPRGQTTPDVYTIRLTVTEAYTSAGQPRQNVASSNTTVRYNDSPAEVIALARDFLVQKFANFNVTPAEAVINFSDSCSGKAEEFDDVKDNRQEVHILSGSFLSPVTSFDSEMLRGAVEGACTFEDIPNSGPNAGRREFVSGTCRLTTVYESFRWFLCESTFNPPYTTTLASLKGRVPGRIVFR
jgi:hypothetical protein